MIFLENKVTFELFVKTENIINLIYRIVDEDYSLILISHIDIDDTLNNKIKKKI